MSEPRLILHVGAPKCGSSALQTNLTGGPDLRDHAGGLLRYVTARPVGTQYRLVKGRMVRRLGRASAYGYACWPNFGRHTDSNSILAAVQEAFAAGEKGGWVPILSCEGWINHPQEFAKVLAALGHPQVDVVCFLRPPAEWMNAAWWQWGIWSGRSVQFWMERMALPYDFADNLARWAEIPGVRLQVRRSRPDAVEKFKSLYGVATGDGVAANPSAPPSLIGFMQRNRRFRETAHAAQAEFIFQRWCPAMKGKSLWALRAKHIHMMRPVTQHSREVLKRILSDEDQADVFADARWSDERSYHAAILDGVSVLDDPADLPVLYAALAEGVQRAASAARQKVEAVPPPVATAPIEDWDAAMADLFDRLITLDARLRRDPVINIMRRVDEGVQRLRSRKDPL